MTIDRRERKEKLRFLKKEPRHRRRMYTEQNFLEDERDREETGIQGSVPSDGQSRTV